MRSLPSFGRRLASDRRGSVLVEFAILAPAICTLFLGVVQVGLHVQNSNAVRNLAADGARMAVVQYQRGNALSTAQLQATILARGVGPKYNLNSDRLTVAVTQPATRIGGVREFAISIDYEAPNLLAFADIGALDIAYDRPVFVLIPV